MTKVCRALKSFTDLPVIVILGSTATGKSKLGIELAKSLNGEIISADSMQVYKGLDIITNKVTTEEQCEVRHHMINIISPPLEFTVTQFKDMASNIIMGLHSQHKVPIVVGGTNYYIESLLWNFLVDNREDGDGDIEKGLQERKDISNDETNIEGESSEPQIPDKEHQSLYERLKNVDPERAEQLHPNNIRKIARSLQIYDSTGQTHSALLREQKSKPGSSHLSGPLRFSKTLIFWLTCEQNVLDQRISDRMENMVSMGLAKEMSDFYAQYRLNKNCINVNKTKENVQLHQQVCGSKNIDEYKIVDSADCNTSISNIHNDAQKTNDNVITGNKNDSNDAQVIVDYVNTGSKNNSNSDEDKDTIYEVGLFQAIGFKEFHAYLTSTNNNLDAKERLFRDGLEKLKRRTIKYSKKQRTWVQNRFLARPAQNVPDVYDLDVTDLQLWNENVLQKALHIANAFINDEIITSLPLERLAQQIDTDKNCKFVCEVCDGKIIIGNICWEEHLKSRKHRKRTSRKRKIICNDDSEFLQ